MKYISYDDAIERGAQVGSGLINMDLVTPPEEEHAYKFIGIFSRNRMEWTLTDIGCVMYGLVTIPIYDTLGD